MEKRIQTWSTIKDGKRVPYTGEIKSFAEYQQEVKAEKLADQMYKDNLLLQLVKAQAMLTAQPIMEQVNTKLDVITDQLNPVSKFFNDGYQAQSQKKRISRKEKERLEDEAHLQKLDIASLQRLKKKGVI